MSKLLIHESPLQVLPSLAKLIGLNEAIILQQLHYRLQSSKTQIDGRKWIFDTYSAWREDHFPFWEESTIKRTFAKLEDKKLVLSGQFDLSKGNARKYYSIDYQALAELEGLPALQNIPAHEGNLPRSMRADRPDHEGNLPRSIRNNRDSSKERETPPPSPDNFINLTDDDSAPPETSSTRQLLSTFCKWGPVENIINFNFQRKLIETEEAFRRINADLSALPRWIDFWREEDWRGRKGEAPSSPTVVYDTWTAFQDWYSRQARPADTGPTDRSCPECSGSGFYLDNPEDISSRIIECNCRKKNKAAIKAVG